MTDQTPTDRTVPVDGGAMHVVIDDASAPPTAPVLLLIHGLAASTDCWEPVVATLAASHRVVRVDLLGHGRSTVAAGGYDVVTQARRVGAALDALGVSSVVAVGHSTGGAVATSLAEQRPELVSALVLVDTGPSLDARLPQNLLARLLLTRLPGRWLWSLRTEASMRKTFESAITRPVDIPQGVVDAVLGMTHRAFVATARAKLDYLAERNLPERLAALGRPLLVVFGADDRRWRPSSAVTYRAVPGARVEMLAGVGHTPMLEDPEATGVLLREFVADLVSGRR